MKTGTWLVSATGGVAHPLLRDLLLITGRARILPCHADIGGAVLSGGPALRAVLGVD